MKTPTQTILILLLLAGGLAGFGQEDRSTPEDTDGQIVIIRQEIITCVQQNKYNDAEKKADSIWNLITRKNTYLLAKEYLLVLYITGDYSTILKYGPKNTSYLSETTSYPDIFRQLQTEARLRLDSITTDIQKDLSAKILQEILFDLLSHNGTENMTKNNNINQDEISSGKLKSQTTYKLYKSKNAFSFYDYDNSIHSGLSVGFGYNYRIVKSSDYNGLNSVDAFMVMFGFRYLRFFGSIDFLLNARTQNTSQVQFNGEKIYGDFYGTYRGGSIKVGYILNQNHNIKFIPSISFSANHCEFYSKKPRLYKLLLVNNYVTAIDQIYAQYFGFNLTIEYQIFEDKHESQGLAGRFSYEYQISRGKENRTMNPSHQLVFAIIYTLI